MPAQPNSSELAAEYVPGLIIALKYKLIRRLGEGGMASVWVAHSEPLDIDVAIKFIRRDVKHPHLSDRLLHEARAAARLGHPAIVRIFDFGTTDSGDPFIVMELLSGDDLGTALKHRGRLAAVKAVRTLLPIAHALATAHEKGIVHRDLKPENIFLAQTEDGGIQPKLVDFGVAKLDHAGFERLTDLGTAIGSPGYMSPEQARGLEVDHRTDIWSLCVALYETVTGRLPFDGKSYNALLRSIIEDTPPPITNFASGDTALWEILKKGFAKRVEERWQSMRDLGQALARWLLERGCNEDIAGASLQAAWIAWRPRNTLPPSARASFASMVPADTLPPPGKGVGADATGKTGAVRPGASNAPGPASTRGARTSASELQTPASGGDSYVPPSERISVMSSTPPAPAARAGRLIVGVVVLLLLAGSGFLVFSRYSSKLGLGAKPAPQAAPAPPPAATEAKPVSTETAAVAPAASVEPAAPSAEEAPSASAEPEAETKQEKRKEELRKEERNKASEKSEPRSKKLEIKTNF